MIPQPEIETSFKMIDESTFLLSDSKPISIQKFRQYRRKYKIKAIEKALIKEFEF